MELGKPSQQLEEHRIQGLPPTFYYVPDFLSAHEESELLANINQQRWVQLAHRRLQVYPAQLSSSNVLLTDKQLPHWLTARLEAKFARLGLFSGTEHGQMNHVLVNEYQPGQGIMPHEDGDAYAPVTVTVSLGSTTVLNLYDKSGEKRDLPRARVLQEERSLLVTHGEAYGGTYSSESLLHGISEIHIDENLSKETICNWSLLGNAERFATGSCSRVTRVSLTCRDVLKVSKLGNKLFGRR